MEAIFIILMNFYLQESAQVWALQEFLNPKAAPAH